AKGQVGSMRKPDLTVWLARLDSNGLRTLLLALLLVVAAQVLAQTLWMLLAGPLDREPAAPDLRVISQSSGTTTSLPLSQQTLEGWALFGESQAPVAGAQESAPETSLRLPLL